MTETFEAHCVGGPMAGKYLPYDREVLGPYAVDVNPRQYRVIHNNEFLGAYIFEEGHKDKGDSFIWHKFIKVI